MPREQPPQSYFPSARLRLIVRLEEFGAADGPAAPTRPPQLRTGKGRADAKLAVVEQDGRLVLLGPGDAPDLPGGPQAQTSSDDGRTHAIEVVPSRLSIARNGIRTAGTMNASIRFRDMPLDPRAIRAVAVQAYAGTLTEEQFARAIAERRPAIVPDAFVDGRGRSRSNLRFSGWIDELEVDLGDGDELLVNIECTDNARILIDQEAPPKLAVSPDEPIDRAIANYLSNFPQYRGLAIEYRPAGSSVPRLSSALGKTAFKPKLGPAPGAGSKLNVFDYLTDVCGAVGHVCRIEFETLVIQRARTLYGSRFPGRPEDPFDGRTLASGRELDRRLFVFGRNVKRPRFRRKFSRVAAFNVEVRCYAPAQKKTLVVRHPAKGERLTKPSPGNANEQTWKVFYVAGIESEESLRAIAQAIYEAVGRNEIESEFETKSLASYGAGAEDPDALDMLPGDALDIEILRDFDSSATAIDVEAQLRARPTAFLRELGFEPAFADAYAEAIANAGMSTTFRLKTLGIEWNADDGIVLSATAVNYIEVRADKSLPEEDEPSVPSPDVVPSKLSVSDPSNPFEQETAAVDAAVLAGL